MNERHHGLRYHAFARALRSRVGARAARVELRDAPGAPDAFRDAAIRAIARRNFGSGIERFVVAWRPRGDAGAAAWRAEAETLLALIPIVGVVAVAPGEAFTAERAAALAVGDGTKPVWIEAPGDAQAGWSGLERAATTGRNAGLPIVGRIGVRGDDAASVAREANALRLRAVNLLPPQHVAPDRRRPEDPFADPPALLEHTVFLDVAADVVERLEPSIQVLGLGRMAPADAILAPDWVRDGDDLPGLHATLEARGTHQGARLTRPR